MLSKSLGQDHVLPLLSLAQKTQDLALSGDDLRFACHRAVMAGARQAVPLAADLARRTVLPHAVVPKLRAPASILGQIRCQLRLRLASDWRNTGRHRLFARRQPHG